MVNDLYVILSGKVASSELVKAPFTDVVIKNVASRVVRDKNGAIVFLYSFFNKDTLIITTNEATLCGGHHPPDDAETSAAESKTGCRL